MAKYNNQMTMQRLFQNPKLSGVLPQFEKGESIKGYSTLEIVRRVEVYIKELITAEQIEERHLKVGGKHEKVLSKVRKAVPLIEQFFNAAPEISKNIKSNQKVYTTFVSVAQLENLKSIGKRLEVLKQVLENIDFNQNFNALNSLSNLPPIEFSKEQQAWAKKVGFKE